MYMIFQSYIFQNFSSRSVGKKTNRFLINELNNSDVMRLNNLPYFKALSKNKDLNTPTIFDGKLCLQMSTGRQIKIQILLQIGYVKNYKSITKRKENYLIYFSITI